MCLSNGDKNNDNPMSKETAKADSLWSLTSTTLAFSPGACVVDITVKAETWATALTVAAHSHGPAIIKINYNIVGT